MTGTLPAGVREEDFRAALSEFTAIVGEAWVISDEVGLQKYADPYPVGRDVAAGPAAVVSPASVDEVQAVVRVANRYGIPLSPVSTGKNNGYGGASPRLPGGVVVNTGAQMNKILEVNEKYGYALLEPGVTYFALAKYLEDTGSSLMIDCPDLGWGSVVGNTLDRGVGYTPYGDHRHPAPAGLSRPDAGHRRHPAPPRRLHRVRTAARFLAVDPARPGAPVAEP